MVSDLLKLLPHSLRQDPVLEAIAEAAEIQLKQAYQEAEAVYNLVDIDKMPEVLLDLLAFEKHVDFYQSSLPIEQKRNLVKSSISLHRKKGTPYAIERVLESLELPGEVFEWFQYNGQPYRFKIEVILTELSKEKLIQLRQLINEYKNKRSWLDFIAVRLPQTQSMEIDCAHYHYPVFLPICGEIHCEGMPGTDEVTEMHIQAVNFSYPAQLPICNEVYPSEVRIE